MATRSAHVLAAAAILGLCGACDTPAPELAEPLSLTETLGGADTAGYERAVEVRDFAFPLDHGPHPDFKTEWWYITGHLESDSGRRFGYQFTLFRSALAPTEPTSTSAWATRQAYMGHFALTDIDGDTFHARERFARGGAGLAGAEAAPMRVWLEGWNLSGTGSEDGFPMTLSAFDAEAGEVAIGLDLTFEPGKGIVLNGDRGLSQKSPEAGNASYYYSLPRMPSRGTVHIGDETFTVTGTSWLDREWSTSVLGEGQIGWDWFALQLDDGRDVMAYRIRRDDGSAASESEGILIAPDGRSRRLDWGSEIQVEDSGATWRSSDGAAEYPSKWTVRIPSEGLTLDIDPLVADQELDLAFRYWEGAVQVTGTARGVPITGLGYVELTGYGASAQGWR